MTATMPSIRRWEARDYARIVSVRFRVPTLIVTFADGAEAGVEVERFDNPTIRSQIPDWSRARAGEHEVLVPTADGEVGIPWDSIRALTDAEFAAHWAEKTADVAREIGGRLRGWRQERRLSRAELARLAGVPLATVVGVETGQHPVDLALLDRLLAALGRNPDDLIEDDPAVDADAPRRRRR